MQVRYPTSVDLLRTSEDLSVMQAQTNGEMGGTYLNRTNLGKCTCKHSTKAYMRRHMQYMQVMYGKSSCAIECVYSCVDIGWIST